MNYKIEKTELLHQGPIFDLVRDQVRYSDGRLVSFETLRHSGAIAILPQDDNGNLLLVRQYRHAVQQVLVEIPAGRLEPQELPLDCAQRELKEEIGMAANSWSELGSFLIAPGYSDEIIHLFAAQDLHPESLPQDADEEIEILSLSLEEAWSQINRGAITDAKTILALHIFAANQ